MGRNGAVASNHPLATLAGYDVLRSGGNAADAAVAVASTLGVVEPYMSGLGGDAFYLVHNAATRESRVINATGAAPNAATAERFIDGIPQNGIRSISVPGALNGWLTLQAVFGTMPASQLFAAAIAYARDGFGATWHFCDFVHEAGAALAKDPGCARTYMPEGKLPEVGAIIRNQALARTLETVAAGGREAYYESAIARGIAGFIKTNGGLIEEVDLVGCRDEIVDPIETAYRGLTILEAPPNSMGFTLLEELNIVENFDLAGMGYCSADLIHTLVEAKKLAFFDRERSRINPRHAAPGAVEPSLAGDTTYFGVVDGQGNAVSGIQSLGNLFGSGVMDPTSGVLFNNRMHTWHLEPDHPNRLEPSKRVRHTMNPPMALKDGAFWALFGTPGGDTQVQVNLQTLTALVDLGLDPQQAVEMPRWESFQPGTFASWPHTGSDELAVEDRVPAGVIDELRSRGHNVRALGALEGPCSAEIIVRDATTGLLKAGSDPRRDGYAMAF
jgi:gamma-glutamyltranspeptidase/glutathione hydrolase